jgi:hypothetical protein
LVNYLSEFSLDPNAWRLKGDLCELTNTKDAHEASRNLLKAIDDYSKAFDLSNKSDKNLLLKSKFNSKAAINLSFILFSIKKKFAIVI